MIKDNLVTFTQFRKELRKDADPKRARISQGFFKTGPGEYGFGDIFIGLTVPVCRSYAQKYRLLKFSDLKKLLRSKLHEERLIALLILVHNFDQKSEKEQSKIFSFYLASTKFINNWNLVDLSAEKIVGKYLLNRSKKVLHTLVRSKNVWERRIAIIATFYFIKNNRFGKTLELAELLLGDSQDLIHKAAGWMLREVGKRSKVVEERFLRKHYKKMPRTMLRYAIERFPPKTRKAYLAGEI